jgi:mRNA interferase MazF
MNFSRGDIVIAAISGDYGKPRPCLVVQSDFFPHMPSLTFCPMSSELRDDVPLLRINISPTPENGLREKSQIAIDKLSTLPKTRIAQKIGKADDSVMLHVTRALAVFLGLG